MYDEELYPELVDYIYSYQSVFMTEEEKVASRTIMYTSKNVSQTMLEVMKRRGWISEEENIKLMLLDGFDVFKNRVVSRIYAQHKHQLQLNLCPKCGKIARTPEAKQCRFCFYSWHSQ